MFMIEDDLHAEDHGDFPNLEQALAELRRRAEVPWDKEPNVAPCKNWRHCGRNYQVIEYDDSRKPWKELRRIPILKINASGVVWEKEWRPRSRRRNFIATHGPTVSAHC